jgi:iron complex transport system ATP-binding protein
MGMIGEATRLVPNALSMGDVAVRVRDLSVELSGKRILEGVDLDMHAGELIVLIGPNGAGKSTMLGAITGDVSYQGSIDIGDTPLTEWRNSDLARRRSVLPQQNTVSFPFSVLEVVEMGRIPWRRTPLEDHDHEAVAEALVRTDTLQFATRPFSSLSGGERARAALARVIAQRTGIVLLDEPTAALDIRHQELVLQLLRERADAGDAVIVVLHELSLAAAYADRVALLSSGRIEAVGPPERVLTAERVSQVYGYPVEVVPHPETGAPLILPQRPVRGAAVPAAGPTTAGPPTGTETRPDQVESMAEAQELEITTEEEAR